MQAGCDENCCSGIRCERELLNGYQLVYVWQSKFQSIPLCAVDARSPSLQTCSLLYEEGGYETKTDFAGDIIGRAGSPAGAAFVQCACARAIRIGSRYARPGWGAWARCIRK